MPSTIFICLIFAPCFTINSFLSEVFYRYLWLMGLMLFYAIHQAPDLITSFFFLFLFVFLFTFNEYATSWTSVSARHSFQRYFFFLSFVSSLFFRFLQHLYFLHDLYILSPTHIGHIKPTKASINAREYRFSFSPRSCLNRKVLFFPSLGHM